MERGALGSLHFWVHCGSEQQFCNISFCAPGALGWAVWILQDEGDMFVYVLCPRFPALWLH